MGIGSYCFLHPKLQETDYWTHDPKWSKSVKNACNPKIPPIRYLVVAVGMSLWIDRSITNLEPATRSGGSGEGDSPTRRHFLRCERKGLRKEPIWQLESRSSSYYRPVNVFLASWGQIAPNVVRWRFIPLEQKVGRRGKKRKEKKKLKSQQNKFGFTDQCQLRIKYRANRPICCCHQHINHGTLKLSCYTRSNLVHFNRPCD